MWGKRLCGKRRSPGKAPGKWALCGVTSSPWQKQWKPARKHLPVRHTLWFPGIICGKSPEGFMAEAEAAGKKYMTLTQR